MNADPSLAFTALHELWPGYGDGHPDGGAAIVAQLAKDMSATAPPDRWMFARHWIATTRGEPAANGDGPDADPTTADLPALTTISIDLCRLADAAERIAAALEDRPASQAARDAEQAADRADQAANLAEQAADHARDHAERADGSARDAEGSADEAGKSADAAADWAAQGAS